MDAPARRATDLGHVLGDEEHGENIAQPLDLIRGKLSGVVVFDEAQKPAMLNAPNLHLGDVRLDRTVVKEKRSEERPASVENLVDPFRPSADGASARQLGATSGSRSPSAATANIDIDRLADNASLGRIFWGQLKWAAGDS
jgi:hypothetical protein